MDPTRLRDDPDQPQGLRDLLDHSVRDLGSRADIAQTAAKLVPLVGAGALGVLTTSSAAKASIWAGKTWWVASVVAGSVAVAGVAVVANTPPKNEVSAPVVIVPQSEPRPVISRSAPATQPGAEPAPEVPEPVVIVPKVVKSASRVVPAVPEPPVVASAAEEIVSAAPPAPPPPPSESQLLGSAQAALSTDPARALKLTAEHRQMFPSGTFTQEREVIEIDALYRLGRKAEADRRAAQFVARNPSSSYGRRVKELMLRK